MNTLINICLHIVEKVRRMGGRFVVEPKTKEDAFSRHVILGLKSINYSVR